MGPCAFVSYGLHVFCMIEVRYSAEFGKWLKGLRDANAYARIVQRIRRLERGNPGDVKSVGGGLHELRIDYGPGYRVYFVYEGSAVVILLCGGDKSTQDRDIKRARALVGN
jgi:putative addiction module killer protein